MRIEMNFNSRNLSRGAMILPLLLLMASTRQIAQAQYPVRWTRAVGPHSRQALRAELLGPPARNEIQTCPDYARALKDDKDYVPDGADESREKADCDVILLVLAAKPSRVSYVRGFKLDESALDLLPASLSEIADEDQAKVKHIGLSWKKYHPEAKLVRKAFNEINVEGDDEFGVNLQIMAFGDFNGDGVEDVLLFRESYDIGGHGRCCTPEPVILTRLAPGGRFKAFEVDDKAIHNAAAKVMGRRSGKPN